MKKIVVLSLIFFSSFVVGMEPERMVQPTSYLELLPREIRAELGQYLYYDAMHFWMIQVAALENWRREFPLQNEGTVTITQFSPDGTLLLTCTDQAGILNLWDVATGKLFRKVARNVEARTVKFSPDGQFIVAALTTSNSVHIVNVCSPSKVNTFKGHANRVRTTAFSPDSRLLAAGSSDQTTQIWDLTTGALKYVFTGQEGSIDHIAFSPNGAVLATASSNNTLCLWNVATGFLMYKINAHREGINNITFSPDSDLIATAGWDSTACIWNVQTGALMQRFVHDDADNVSRVLFISNGRFIITCSNDIHIWNVQDGNLIKTIETEWDDEADDTHFSTFILSSDERLFAVSSMHKNEEVVFVGNILTGQIWIVLSSDDSTKGQVDSIAFNPDGNCIATGADKIARIWQLYSPEIKKTIAQLSLDAKILLYEAYRAFFNSEPLDLSKRLQESIQFLKLNPLLRQVITMRVKVILHPQAMEM